MHSRYLRLRRFQPPAIAALNSSGSANGKAFFGETYVQEKPEVVRTVSEILVSKLSSDTVNNEGTLKWIVVALSSAGVGRWVGTNAAQIAGWSIWGTRGRLSRSGSIADVSKSFYKRPPTLEPTVLGGRSGMILYGWSVP